MAEICNILRNTVNKNYKKTDKNFNNEWMNAKKYLNLMAKYK